ncbi:hypothetical protein PIB30_083663, partial [Stylosanthes scabra]|nr:hypothetical protein [Stylosanthes scabra]
KVKRSSQEAIAVKQRGRRRERPIEDKIMDIAFYLRNFKRIKVRDQYSRRSCHRYSSSSVAAWRTSFTVSFTL